MFDKHRGIYLKLKVCHFGGTSIKQSIVTLMNSGSTFAIGLLKSISTCNPQAIPKVQRKSTRILVSKNINDVTSNHHQIRNDTTLIDTLTDDKKGSN